MTAVASVESAARDRKVCPSHLRKWLADAGHVRQPGVAHRPPAEVIDHVIAEHRAQIAERRRAGGKRRTGTITERIVTIIATAPEPPRFGQIVAAAKLTKIGVARSLTYAKRLGLVRTVRHPSGRHDLAVWVCGSSK